MEIKRRRILPKDFDSIEEFICDEMSSREGNSFRRDKETIWKELDRQLRMKPMVRRSKDGRPVDPGWHNTIELGELAKASEIITADVMRMLFPDDRTWFEPHVLIPGMTDEQTGRAVVLADEQETADDNLRSLMGQQHLDFGFQARFEMSVKEALHHGSFAAEVRWEEQLMAEGSRVRNIGSPVWVPYSMWNTFPDPSPSVIGTNLFYTGALILVEYVPLWKLKKMARGDGWLQDKLKLLKDKQTHKLRNDEEAETSDVKLVKYFGDLTFDRKSSEGIYVPNCKAIVANDTLVYVEKNEMTPYPPVIFSGYERIDVLDPYYTSPLIKQSPIQKFTTVMANNFADAVDLRVKPPIEYDGLDPEYAKNGGPSISPGAKNAKRSMGKSMVALEIGDPKEALAAMQFGFRQMQEGLGVSSLRAGNTSSDRQTATEARLQEQGSEVRTVDFVKKLGPQALRPFLYMQHAINRKKMMDYPAYSNEMNTPDFVVFTKKDVDVEAHFDVTGARSILGDERRKQGLMQTTAFFMGNPMSASKLNVERIMVDLYRDNGKKNPEEWVRVDNSLPPEVQMQMQQMQQMLQAAMQELEQLKGDRSAEIAKIQADYQAKIAKIEADREESKRTLDVKEYEARIKEFDAATKAAKAQADTAIEEARLRAEMAAQGVERQLAQNQQVFDQALAAMQMSVEEMKARKVVIPKRRKKVLYNDAGDVVGIEEEDMDEAV